MRAPTPKINPQERFIEKKVTDYAVKKLGWLSRKLQWIGRHGAPDRVFMRFGKIIFVEFKQYKKKPTEHQRLEHERLMAVGMDVYVIDSIEDGIELFDRLTAGQANYASGYDMI